MKCEVCSELLEEYVDGELAPQDLESVDAHLIACVECSESFSALSAEQELFARYDREIEVPPFLWTRVAAHTVSESNRSRLRWTPSLAGAIAVLLIALAIGIAYLQSNHKAPETKVAISPSPVQQPNPVPKSVQSAVPKPELIASKPRPRIKPVIVHAPIDQSDVL